MNKFQAAIAAFKNPALVRDGVQIRQIAERLKGGNFGVIAGVEVKGETHLRIIDLTQGQRALIRNTIPKLGLNK